MAAIGQQLTQPESGWKRYDDTHPSIVYHGTWNTDTSNPAHYHTSEKLSASVGAKVTVKFIGTSLRLIGSYWSTCSDDIDVYIDGVLDKKISQLGTSTRMVLSYEKTGLTGGTHEIVFVNNKISHMSVDAIDINTDGRLLHAQEVTSIDELTVGMRIRCHYKAVSGVVGELSRLGEETYVNGINDFITSSNSIAPDGDFYFIMVDELNGKKVLMADRNIQNNIKWEILNFAGLVTGSIVNLVEGSQSYLRLPSGGVIGGDIHNEWDRYIVNGVFPSDLSVWNSTSIWSLTSTTYSGGDTKVIRGGLSDTRSRSKLNTTDLAPTTTGFRPILEVVAIHSLPPEPEVPSGPIADLYEVESGLIFIDDFTSLHARWLQTPQHLVTIDESLGVLTLNRSKYQDTMLLADVPQGEFAFEVIADYTPVEKGDEAGIVLWNSAIDKLEYLEYADTQRETSAINWMSVREGDNWLMYADYGNGYDFTDSSTISATKWGVVLKKGEGLQFVPLKVDMVIATKGNMFTLINVEEGQVVQIVDTLGDIVAQSTVGKDNHAKMRLPYLEIEGKLQVLGLDGLVLYEISGIFHGGDIYRVGSGATVRWNGTELNRTMLNELGKIEGSELVVKLDVYNPTKYTINNLMLSIAKYSTLDGWQWADIAPDSQGPGNYGDTLTVPSLTSGQSVEFWVRVVSNNGGDLEPIIFNIFLEHD